MTQRVPNSRLLGIQLTISTHSGPQTVFHYPPTVTDYLSIIENSDSNKLFDDANRSSKPNLMSSTNDVVAHTLSKDDKSTSHDTFIRSSKSNRNIPTPQDDFVNNGAGVMSSSTIVRDSFSISGNKNAMDSDSEQDFEYDISESELSTDYIGCDSTDSDSSSSTSSENDSNVLLSHSKIKDKDENNNFKQPVEPSEKKLSSSNKEKDDIDIKSEMELSLMFEKDAVISNFILNERYFKDDVVQDLDKIFDFSAEFVAEFCSPERAMCNTRFELTIDKFCFLGLPIHVDKEGNWKKMKKRKHLSKRSSSIGTKGSVSLKQKDHNELVPTISSKEEQQLASKLKESSANGAGTRDNHEDNNNQQNINMTMFHVCFIMDPPLSEYNERVDDMFRNVVARLSLHLRTLEAKESYVSRECSKILKERETIYKLSKTYKTLKNTGTKAKYFYKRILTKSSLARALVSCVDNLQRNNITCLQLGDNKMITLQIPIQNELKVLPKFRLEPVLKGSFLTSVLNSKFLLKAPTKGDDLRSQLEEENIFGEDEEDDLLDYALLPLSEPDLIIQNLETTTMEDDVTSVLLVHLIRHIQPTLPLKSYEYLIDDVLGTTPNSSQSFQERKESIQTNLLRSCALHLLYWRHVRIIIPLSSRNTYIVSPLAPIQGYSNDLVSNYHDRLFDNQRPLIYQYQDMFKESFSTLPILSLFLKLLSTGKPKPYGSIIPSKEHKPIYLRALAWLLRNGFVTQQLTFVCIRVDKQIKMQVEEDLEKEGYNKRKERNQNNHDQMDNIVPRKSSRNSSDLNSSAHNGNNNNNIDEFEEDMANFDYGDPKMDRDYTIILEPERASAIEKRWIYKCIQDQPSDIQIIFNKLIKYFNGRTPMEVVLLKENITRHELKKLLIALDKYMLEFKHW